MHPKGWPRPEIHVDDGSAVVLALLATQILWTNLLTDSTPALAMGIDPEIDDVMARAPRRLTDRAIDGRMWRGIVSIGLVMALATLFCIDLFLPGGLVDGSDTPELVLRLPDHRSAAA